MNSVQIIPLPAWCRSLPARVWPLHPPIFPDGPPTEADRALALELIEVLDAQSQRWYADAARRLQQEVSW